MRSKGKLYQIIAIVLALLLTVGHAGFLLSAGRQEPGRPPLSAKQINLLTETYTDQVSEGYMLMAAGSGDHGASGQEDGEEEQEKS